MFESLRKASGALQELASTLEDIRLVLTAQAENTLQSTALSSRVAEIEVGYAKWTAEAEAAMLKADALFKNARNSEERARDAQKKSAAAAEAGVEGEAEMRAAYEALYGTDRGNSLPDSGDAHLLAEPPVVTESTRNNRLRSKFRI